MTPVKVMRGGKVPKIGPSVQVGLWADRIETRRLVENEAVDRAGLPPRGPVCYHTGQKWSV